MQAPQIKGRVFLVGCPRSGTTLLQSLLAAHSQIASWPETMFFQDITGQLERRMVGAPARNRRERLHYLVSDLRIRLGIASALGDARVRKYLTDIGRSDLEALYPAGSRRMRPKIRACLHILDRMAAEQGRPFWLEKSPNHLYYVDIIERYLPGARFIHLVRNGADNVASLHDAAQKYGWRFWGPWPYSLECCVQRWNHSVQITQRHLHKENHTLARYEQVVDDPASVLKPLCAFIGVAFEEGMLQGYRDAAGRVALKNEVWKSAVGGAIQNANATKFYELFDEAQRRYILERLIPDPFPSSVMRK